ncbi:hypothetical protein Bbelb_361750 [Branchiostoma belcheri]|nr:hypothetical protein Bbelb_361750 [Branchiostoma belcheri]
MLLAAIMVTVISCNFARVAIHCHSQSFTTEDGTVFRPDKQFRFAQFQTQFEGHKDFDVSYSNFRKYVDKVDSVFKGWARAKEGQHRDDMKRYIAAFNPEAWKLLSQTQKASHQLQSERDGKKVQCKACFVSYRATADLFNGRAGKDKPTRSFFEASPLLQVQQKQPPKDLKKAANEWYTDGNRTFLTLFGTSLANGLLHVPEVQETFAQHNLQKQQRTVAANVKHNIEKQWQEQNKDVIVHQGTRESDRKYEERRLAMGYETIESSKKRARERAADEAAGSTRRGGGLEKRCSGEHDGKVVSWRAYAKDKGVHNKQGKPASNGGQIIQDWLVQEGVNIHRFQSAVKSQNTRTTPRPRRRKQRIPNSGDVPMPTPRAAKEMRKSLAMMIKDGEIPIGEMIVPQEFEKMVFDAQSGKVHVKRFTVEGRKHPLAEVRSRSLKEQQKFMRTRDGQQYDEMEASLVKERLKELNEYDEDDCITNMRNKLKRIEHTRHITIWEDSSQVSNHGHMVYMTSTVYDPAIHLTDAEYLELYGERICVQSHVEQPCIYMVARCSCSDNDQLCYSAERRECLHQMSMTVSVEINGTLHEYSDVLRFFKGDLPAREFEAGQQRGGHFPCPCGVNAARFDDIEHTYRAPHMSLAERICLLKEGEVTWEKSVKGMTAVDNMSKEELVKDLSSRGVLDVHEARGKPAKELCMILKNELHGIKRPPALLFHCPETSIESLNLEKYEVLPCEPLHDISHHIQHIFEELPFHVSSDVKNDIKQVYNATLGTKELKRGCDYRVALIALANTLEGKATPLVLQLITSLLEIQRLCYLPAEKRCQREILRLHNQSFIHAMCMRQVIPKPKKLTARCLYGIYFHTLTTHAPTVFRIVALSSAHTESEERVFNQLRGIHRTTGCSRRPGQVIGNMLVRTHCENVLRSDKGTTYQPDSIVSNAAKVKQTGVEDTIVPLHIIDKFPKAWQAHCERLADYLQCGKGEWWTVHEEGVIFHDGSTHPDSLPSGPQMLHFRSSSLKTVEQHLCQSWQKCLDENTVIPLRKVYMYETDGERNLTAIKRTNFIPMFEACSEDLDTLTATADSYDDMMEGEEEEDISELVQQVREVEDVFTVHTSEDDAVHTSEDDDVHTSEDDAVHTSEDDAVHTSEDDAVRTSEDDAVHTSEDDAVHTSEDDAIHTSEDDAVHTSEDDRTVYSGEEQHGPTTSFDKQPSAAFMSPPGPSAVRSRCSEHTPLRRNRRGKTDPVQLFSSAQPSGHTSEKGKEEKQSQSSWTRNLRGLLGDIQEIESFEALRKKLKEGRTEQQSNLYMIRLLPYCKQK